jgi:STE24 endopeptidase
MMTLFLAQCAQVAIPEASTQAMSYYNSGNLLFIFSLVWGFLFPFLILWTGFSAKLEKYSKKLAKKKWFFTLAIFLIFYGILAAVISWPLDWYAEYYREHSYGLSTQTFKSWFQNWTLSLALSVIGSISIIWIFYYVIKKSPQRWWIYGAITSTLIAFFMSFIQPIWIDPLFNEFKPMQNKELEHQIQLLAERAGIQGSRIFEVNKSAETKTLNAYVTGIGASKRIVLWDTTLDKMTCDQILFVMGHEMGHYVLNHIWKGFFFFSICSFIVFFATFKVGNFLISRFHSKFKFKKFSEFASYPLLTLLFAFFMFLLSPFQNYVTRTMEHQADIFGLEITQNNTAAAEAFVVLQQNGLVNPSPGPLYKFFRCDHPTLSDRIEFCNQYCPWCQGEALQYGKYFKDNCNNQ